MNHLRDPRPGDTYERDGHTSVVRSVQPAAVEMVITYADGANVTALLHRGYLADARRFWTLVTRGG